MAHSKLELYCNECGDGLDLYFMERRDADGVIVAVEDVLPAADREYTAKGWRVCTTCGHGDLCPACFAQILEMGCDCLLGSPRMPDDAPTLLAPLPSCGHFVHVFHPCQGSKWCVVTAAERIALALVKQK